MKMMWKTYSVLVALILLLVEEIYGFYSTSPSGQCSKKYCYETQGGIPPMELPYYMPKCPLCPMDDYQAISSCVQVAANYILPKLEEGDAKFGWPALNRYKYCTEIDFSSVRHGKSCNFVIKTCATLHNLHKFKATKRFIFKPADLWARVSLYKKQLMLTGNYEMNGYCCGKNVKSKGIARFTADNVLLDWWPDIGCAERDYMHIIIGSKSNATIDFSSLSVQLTDIEDSSGSSCSSEDRSSSSAYFQYFGTSKEIYLSNCMKTSCAVSAIKKEVARVLKNICDDYNRIMHYQCPVNKVFTGVSDDPCCPCNCNNNSTTTSTTSSQPS